MTHSLRMVAIYRAYIKNVDYLNLPPPTYGRLNSSAASSLTSNNSSPSSQPEPVTVESRGTIHEYEYPNLTDEIHADVSARIGVVHAYVYTSTNVVENLKSLSPLKTHHGQSSSSIHTLSTMPVIQHDYFNSHCDSEGAMTTSPNSPPTGNNPLDHPAGVDPSNFIAELEQRLTDHFRQNWKGELQVTMGKQRTYKLIKQDLKSAEVI